MSDEPTPLAEQPEPSVEPPLDPAIASRAPLDWLTFGFLVMFVALALLVTSLILLGYSDR
jgi:hypothetical protein